MEINFFWTGIIYLILLFVPNIIWTKNQPVDYEKYVVNENKVLLAFERIGEVLVCCTALVYVDFGWQGADRQPLWFVLSALAMLLYEIYWVRYFRSEKTLKDFYSSLLGIPVAGATLPVIAFFLLGVYRRDLLLMGAVVVLGIGHIGIHLNHRKEII